MYNVVASSWCVCSNMSDASFYLSMFELCDSIQYYMYGEVKVHVHNMYLSLARDAMRTGNNPVIIDNTNTNAWEMKPYVLLVSNLHNIMNTSTLNYLSCMKAKHST